LDGKNQKRKLGESWHYRCGERGCSKKKKKRCFPIGTTKPTGERDRKLIERVGSRTKERREADGWTCFNGWSNLRFRFPETKEEMEARNVGEGIESK